MCKPSPVKSGSLCSGSSVSAEVQLLLPLCLEHSTVSSAPLTCSSLPTPSPTCSAHGTQCPLWTQHRAGGALANTAISKQENPSPEKDPGILLEIRGFLTLAWGPFLHSSGIHTKRKLIIYLTSREKEVSDQPKHSESSKASNRKTQAGWMKGSC